MTGGQGDLFGKRVLVVEDVMLIAFDLIDMIEQAGGTPVGPAPSIEEALHLIDAEGSMLDAAILDVALRGEDVYPVADELDALSMPFLFHTGHGEREELKNCFPGVTVCNKPVKRQELVEAVSQLLPD